jgi:hypothetical protein
VAGDAVFEQDAVDAGRGEPVADFGALEIDGEDVVTAAGKNHDCRAGVVAGGLVEGEGGRGHVAEADEGLAGDEVVFGSGCICFSGGIGGRARCDSGPDRQSEMAGSGRPS